MRKRDRTPKTYTRLTHPLVRDSRDEPFRQASWEEALDRAALGIEAARGAFGMFSCARATNEMNYVAQKFARVVMAPTTSTPATGPVTPRASPASRPPSDRAAGRPRTRRSSTPTSS